MQREISVFTETWLISSVGGVILLGATGSILAVGLLELAKYLFKKIIPNTFKSCRRYIQRRLAVLSFMEGANVMRKTIGGVDTFGTTQFFCEQIINSIMYFSCFVAFFIPGVILLGSNGFYSFNYPAFFLISNGFAFLIYGIKAVFAVRMSGFLIPENRKRPELAEKILEALRCDREIELAEKESKRKAAA